MGSVWGASGERPGGAWGASRGVLGMSRGTLNALRGSSGVLFGRGFDLLRLSDALCEQVPFIFECFWHEQIHGSWRNSSKRSAASAPRLNGRHSILLLNLNDFSKDKFLRILKLLKGLLSEVTVCLLIFFL